MRRKRMNMAELLTQFNEAHQLGAEKFGWNWIIANKQAIRACEQVGLEPTDLQMKTLLSLAALHILTNTRPAPAASKPEAGHE